VHHYTEITFRFKAKITEL